VANPGICDSFGREAPKACVAFAGSGQNNIKHFIDRAVLYYDRMEVARVRAYNLELAVNIICRRLWHTPHSDLVSYLVGEAKLLDKMEMLFLARHAWDELAETVSGSGRRGQPASGLGSDE